ncbi:MAG: peptide transporter, partial [Nitratiruptor sp.]|nr:peptide transporter [Nitratiruptor sp.]NPA84033.1 peptide transporter [Campylobacterota bacterium]
LFALVAMAGIIYPNITHAQKYIMPSVFSEPEVQILERFKKIAKRDDYVLTWWDYGYPVRYYADVKTLIDGGKHSGDVNFPVSFALTTPSQRASYNMAILDVYFTEKFYDENITGKSYLQGMMDYYGFKDPNKFLEFLKKPIQLPEVKEDIYYFLPYRMLQIFPTVARFSQIDLLTGKELEHPFYYLSSTLRKRGHILDIGRGIQIDLQRAQVRLGDKSYPLHRFTTILFQKSGKNRVQVQTINPRSSLNAIYVPALGTLLLVDDAYYKSTYIQLYLFHNYEGSLFEPVILSPYAAIYRIKK